MRDANTKNAPHLYVQRLKTCAFDKSLVGHRHLVITGCFHDYRRSPVSLLLRKTHLMDERQKWSTLRQRYDDLRLKFERGTQTVSSKQL